MSSGSDITLRPSDTAALTGGAPEEEGEGDKGKSTDPKKLQKVNKELAKTNTQLTKLIDILRHEKESLTLDKNKLKSELKSSEKDLKKANSALISAKSEVDRLRAKTQKQGGSSSMGEGTGELQERVRQLEAELTQRDEKLEKFRKRLGGRLSQLESVGVVPGEQETALEKKEREMLAEENSELREKVVSLETDLNMLLKLMDDQQKEEFAQSSSTELSLSSIISPSSSYSDPRRGGGTGDYFSPSPRNSPALQRRAKTADDIATLQSCLQMALEEKKAAEQHARELENELDNAMSELEKAKSSWAQEKDKLLRELLKVRGEMEARERIGTHDRETQHPLAAEAPVAVSSSTADVQSQSEVSSHTRSRTSSSGSLTSNTELDKSTDSSKSDGARPGERRETARGKRGALQKQRSRENFTAALAVFQGGGDTVASPKKERRPSDTSQGSQSARSSTSPAPTLASQKTTTIAGKPPIHPSSATSSAQHSRQSSVEETGQKSPTKMSTAAKRTSRTVAQRRTSFEEQSPGSPTKLSPKHSRTASSPIMTKALGSPVVEKKTEAEEEMIKEEKKFDEERARREQERRKRELEIEEKKRRELEEKRQQEEKEKERQRKEKEEMDRVRREREEKEKERKRELEEKRKREKEERERKRQEELEKKRQLEEQRRKEQLAEKERQKAREIELERKRKEEQEAALKRQKEEEEQKKKQKETTASKKQKEEDERKKRQEEIEKKLQLEEEKRAAEKAAQAATDPSPRKVNQYQSPFGSIAMRRAAFEQNSSPSSSPPVVLRHHAGSSPVQRPKSVDFAAIMSASSPQSSPAVSPTPQMSSITVTTSKSPQGSPMLNQRKEMREVSVKKGTTIQKPSPPVTTAAPRAATVSITTTCSSPPLRRAKTLSHTPTSLAVSSPDLTSIGTSNGSSTNTTQEVGWSPTTQQRTLSSGPKSPLSERKMAKSVSFSPNLSTTGSRPQGILKPTAPPQVSTTSHTPSSVNRMRFGPAQPYLGLPNNSEDLKKAQSLQNIPEHAPPSPTPPAHTPPAAPHVTRRPRSERAKTTSLSRADTANLVNLISKLQDKEKAPGLGNGVDKSIPQQRNPPGRPVSMYGSITPSR